MPSRPRVLYAVLNWGLGHATRSIPVIYKLLAFNFKPVIAADGLALEILKKTFPQAEFIELKPLELKYGQHGSQAIHLAMQSPKLLHWYKKERNQVKSILANHAFAGIISDNRPTVFSKDIPSVYLTHQLHVEAGIFSTLATSLHLSTYKNFSDVWVPDFSTPPGLSGKLGHPEIIGRPVKYIGPQSDLIQAASSTRFGLGIILSGPEPQRSNIENDLIRQLESEEDVLLIRGTTQPPTKAIPQSWRVIDLADRGEINRAFTECETLISRCGYSTLMDLEIFPKPAILIPTPGQPEQEYLASMKVHQSKFAIQKQDQLDVKSGISMAKEKFQATSPNKEVVDWEALFSLFKGK